MRDYHCTVVALGRSSPEAGPESGDDQQVERDYYARFMCQHPRASAAEMKCAFEKTRACWEAHRTIRQLSALGGRVEYMVADVTDRDQVASVIRQIVSKHGRIDLWYMARVCKHRRVWRIAAWPISGERLLSR